MTVEGEIQLEVVATEANFQEAGYLSANPDVRKAIEAGIFADAHHHFRVFGHSEDRKINVKASGIDAARARKMDRIRAILKLDMHHEFEGGRYSFLHDDLRRMARIAETDRESANGYDAEMLELVARYANGLMLDCGAGRRGVYYPNVVNVEIVPYESTDILAVGEALPFQDASFDCVLSVAVLEHVRDPFQAARELARVLKPGGELFCTVPFLQPLHGYPHHYFNATKQGIRRLFEDDLRVERVYVPETGHPAYALDWFLASWGRGLAPDALDRLRAMSVGDLMDMRPEHLSRSPAGALAPGSVDELASGFVLRATRE